MRTYYAVDDSGRCREVFITQLKLLILFTAYHTDTAYCRVTYFREYKILRISQVYRTFKIFILKIITLSFLLLTICSSSKIYSQNILFKANFNNPRNFISSRISHPTVCYSYHKCGKIHWAKLLWFSRVSRKFSHEHLAIVK